MEESANENSKHKRKAKRRTGLGYTVLVLLLLAAAGGCIFWYRQYHQVLAKDPTAQQKQWTNQLAQLVIVPNEQPIITTVLDKSKLTNQMLSKEAENGDRLYIFTKARRLVLYRPSDKKVVDMLTIQSK